MNKYSNSFFLINPSPWPFLSSVSLLSIAFTLIFLIMSKNVNFFMMALVISFLLLVLFLWWKDLNRESSFLGEHCVVMMNMLKYSMIMFIVSEVMFFVSFFWAFFHLSISPDVEIGCFWPPVSVKTFNPMGMPLMNSLILLSSGCTITLSHHLFYSGNLQKSINFLAFTIILGIFFTICQGVEYYNSNFSFSDSCYGSVFFLTTGFHGIHVIVGTVFLVNSFFSMVELQNFNNHFISFDLSAWYWHFVDVVWLFVYSFIYWWGSMN